MNNLTQLFAPFLAALTADVAAAIEPTPGGGGAPLASADEFHVTGLPGVGYETLEAAIAAVNAAGPWTFASAAKIVIHPRSIILSAGVTVPRFCSIEAQRCKVQPAFPSGNVFTLSGFNRLTGLVKWGGNTTNTGFFIDSGDTTDNSIEFCRLWGGGMRFLRCDGANWARINVEHCTINFAGVDGYAFQFNNSGPTRYVDTWINDVFTDAYGNFSINGNFGGNITIYGTGGVQDLRIKRSTIRGNNPNYTGVRVASLGGQVLLAGNNLDSEGVNGQSGFDFYIGANAIIIDAGGNSAKRGLVHGGLHNRGTLASPG